MTLEQTKNLIKESQTGFSILEKELQSAMETRDEYNRQIKNARARLDRKEKSPYPDNYVEKYIEALKKGNIPETTLIQKIDEAIQTNDEFNENIYKSALYSVANDKSIYKYFKLGSRWQSNLDLQILFEEEAGTLIDWSIGVHNYRRTVLHSKGLENDAAGEKATEFWFTKVFGTTLNTKTVAGRIELSMKKAAFWQILNSGSPPSMASDRPGGYNPIQSTPTNFIGDAEIQIEDNFLVAFREEFSKWADEEKELKGVIDEYIAKRDEYSSEVKELRAELKLNQRILNSFGAKKDFVNRDKLTTTIRKTRAGEEFDNPRINLAMRGSGVSVLISEKQFKGLLPY